ncbi:MAG: hypothetical protein WA510_04470 [Acidobacteriaceae bacterium]
MTFSRNAARGRQHPQYRAQCRIFAAEAGQSVAMSYLLEATGLDAQRSSGRYLRRDSVVGVSHVHATIDRLALAGLNPADRTALVKGLKSRGTHILAASIPSRRIPVMRLGRMPLAPGAGGRAFGEGLARAMGRSLTP